VEPYSGTHTFPGATSVKEVPLPKGYKKWKLSSYTK
jgi:hypothetical protein